LANLIDIAVLIIFLFHVIMGIIRGAVKEIINIIGLIVSYILANQFSFKAAQIIKNNINLTNKAILNIAGFISVFIIVWIIFKVINFIINKIIKTSKSVTFYNRVIGFFLGGLKGLVIITFLGFMFVLIPVKILEKAGTNFYQKSKFLKAMYELKPTLLNIFKHTSFASQAVNSANIGDKLTKILSAITNDSSGKKILHDKEVQRLFNHPKVAALLKNPDFKKDISSGNLISIFSNPRLNEMLEDKEVSKLIESIEPEKLILKYKKN